MKAAASTYGNIDLELQGETPSLSEIELRRNGFVEIHLSLDQFFALMQAGRSMERLLRASLSDHAATKGVGS